MVHGGDHCTICMYIVYVYAVVCSFHVNGNYWQTGWESLIIELKESLLFLTQLQSLATRKLLVSFGSGIA